MVVCALGWEEDAGGAEVVAGTEEPLAVSEETVTKPDCDEAEVGVAAAEVYAGADEAP